MQSPAPSPTTHPDPFTLPILPCSRITTGFDQLNRRFIVDTTTPVKDFKITKSSGAVRDIKIKGAQVSFYMEIPNVKDFHVKFDVTDECDVWHSGMETLKQ